MNPVRGENALVVGNMTYRLKLTTGAIVAAERKGERAFLEMMAQAHWFSHAQLMLWAAMREFHPGVDFKMVDKIIDTVGINKVVETVLETFQLAFPKEEAAKPEGNTDP